MATIGFYWNTYHYKQKSKTYLQRKAKRRCRWQVDENLKSMGNQEKLDIRLGDATKLLIQKNNKQKELGAIVVELFIILFVDFLI